MIELPTILIFMGVIVVTALIFGIWVVVTMIRLFFRAIFGLGRAILPSEPRQVTMPAIGRGPTCPHTQCRAVNPPLARFCRRCGQSLPQPQTVIARRAAVL